MSATPITNRADAIAEIIRLAGYAPGSPDALSLADPKATDAEIGQLLTSARDTIAPNDPGTWARIEDVLAELAKIAGIVITVAVPLVGLGNTIAADIKAAKA